MVKKIMDKQKKITEELNVYQILFNRNASIQERIQKLKLEEYIEEAKILRGTFN